MIEIGHFSKTVASLTDILSSQSEKIETEKLRVNITAYIYPSCTKLKYEEAKKKVNGVDRACYDIRRFVTRMSAISDCPSSYYLSYPLPYMDIFMYVVVCFDFPPCFFFFFFLVCRRLVNAIVLKRRRRHVNERNKNSNI